MGPAKTIRSVSVIRISMGRNLVQQIFPKPVGATASVLPRAQCRQGELDEGGLTGPQEHGESPTKDTLPAPATPRGDSPLRRAGITPFRGCEACEAAKPRNPWTF